MLPWYVSWGDTSKILLKMGGASGVLEIWFSYYYYAGWFTWLVTNYSLTLTIELKMIDDQFKTITLTINYSQTTIGLKVDCECHNYVENNYCHFHENYLNIELYIYFIVNIT